MRTWYRPSLLVVPCLLLWAASGCEVVLGIEERPVDVSNTPTDAGDAGAGDVVADQVAEQSEEAATDAGCSGSPPLRPLADDPSDGDLDLVFALHAIDYGADGGWKTLGFDLDGTNTVPGGTAPKCTWGNGEVPPAAFDHGCGLDNVVGAALWEILFPLLPEQLSEIAAGVKEGKQGLVLRVTGYNGQPNDTTVVVSAFKTSGIDSPTWTGADRWTLNRDGLAEESVPLSKYIDPQAYVADGVLVARLLDFPVGLKLGGAPVSWIMLKRSVFSATITYDAENNFHRLDDGRLGGSLNDAEFLNALRAATGCSSFEFYRNTFCSHLDVAVDGGAECDAWSMGLGFEAWEAQLGDVVDGETPLACNDEGCGSL